MLGGPGEIFIGGARVGRGYRNRPEQTADRFVLIYSAAGRVRGFTAAAISAVLANGQIWFRGRVDTQVKIRGYRVEPEASPRRWPASGGLLLRRRRNGDISDRQSAA